MAPVAVRDACGRESWEVWEIAVLAVVARTQALRVVGVDEPVAVVVDPVAALVHMPVTAPRSRKCRGRCRRGYGDHDARHGRVDAVADRACVSAAQAATLDF